MNWTEKDHTWVICAYGSSPYLEECIQSLTRQTVRSGMIMITSTPSDFLDGLSEKYQIPLKINHGEHGIGGDWNFGIRCAKTGFVTLAHQDDVYDPDYLEAFLSAINHSRDPILYFTGYDELRQGKRVQKNHLLQIKRIMLTPVRCFPSAKWARRLSLSFGNPICCPAITYRTNVMKKHPFDTGWKSNLDWDMTERLSKMNGSFVYLPKSKMCHRIHEESTTSQIIGDNARNAEDLEMFRRFWPDRLANWIAGKYAAGEKSNQV